MYIPTHFALDAGQTQAALASGGFAHLVTPVADGLVSTPLPLLYDASACSLLGHVARNNPHWQAVPTGDSLAIVTGPDAYVSPSFYASKAEHGRVVPTWNYDVLHVHGRLVVHDDVDWLRDLVTRLTDAHEAGRAAPWQVSDAPGRFVDGQLRAIVGIELVVTGVEGKAKLSQNRSDADRAGVVAGLAASGSAAERAVADRMRHDHTMSETFGVRGIDNLPVLLVATEHAAWRSTEADWVHGVPLEQLIRDRRSDENIYLVHAGTKRDGAVQLTRLVAASDPAG